MSLRGWSLNQAPIEEVNLNLCFCSRDWLHTLYGIFETKLETSSFSVGSKRVSPEYVYDLRGWVRGDVLSKGQLIIDF